MDKNVPALSPEMFAFKTRLQDMQITPELRDYLLNIALRLENEVNTLSSFLPFTIELNIY